MVDREPELAKIVDPFSETLDHIQLCCVQGEGSDLCRQFYETLLSESGRAPAGDITELKLEITRDELWKLLLFAELGVLRHDELLTLKKGIQN